MPVWIRNSRCTTTPTLRKHTCIYIPPCRCFPELNGVRALVAHLCETHCVG